MDMKIELTIEKMVEKQLLPNQVILLLLMYNQKFDEIKSLFGIKEAIIIRDSLIGTPYILNTTGSNIKFMETLISRENVADLLGIKTDANINFWEFYNCYPVKVGSRVLRASGPTSQLALKHEKKYLMRVKTNEGHLKAIASISAYVAKQKSSGKLEFLQNMETVLNNSSWEQWEVFIQESGKEEEEWNSTTI